MIVLFFMDAVRRILKELKENSSKLNIKVMIIHMSVFGITILSLIVYVIFAVTVEDFIEKLETTHGYISPEDSIMVLEDFCQLGYYIPKMAISWVIQSDIQGLAEIILAVIIFKLSAPIKKVPVSVIAKKEKELEVSDDPSKEIIERKGTYDTDLSLEEFGSIKQSDEEFLKSGSEELFLKYG